MHEHYPCVASQAETPRGWVPWPQPTSPPATVWHCWSPAPSGTSTWSSTCSQQGWSPELSDAAIVRTSDEARALLAESAADDVGAVGAYIAPVEIKNTGKIKPGNLREHIRSEGVTIDLPVPA